MGSENPSMGKLLPWGPLTPEGKGQLLAQTPGPQAMDLPAVGALPPPPGALTLRLSHAGMSQETMCFC